MIGDYDGVLLSHFLTDPKRSLLILFPLHVHLSLSLCIYLFIYFLLLFYNAAAALIF